MLFPRTGTNAAILDRLGRRKTETKHFAWLTIRINMERIFFELQNTRFLTHQFSEGALEPSCSLETKKKTI